MTTAQRIELLAQACRHPDLARLLGPIDSSALSDWVAAELGRADALDRFRPHGPLRSRAIAPAHILHIVSGNTPHAAFQSLLRGLLLGSHNTIKLPSSGLPELTRWVGSLPDALHALVVSTTELTDSHWQRANVVVAIGSDATMQQVQEQIRPDQTFIPHGHKLSIGVVTADFEQAATLAAKDSSLFNQRGCLSPHAIYVQGDARKFATLMAQKMARFNQHTPAESLSLSEAGAVANLRETTRFLAANGDTTELWHSGDLAWTVIWENDSTLKLSCLNRCVYIKPLPEPCTAETLGAEAHYLSTIALHPFDPDLAERLAELPAHRICPLGKSQEPSLFWHHDGFAPLASLVKWKDIG
ncbi:hypothetical protein JIN77_02915 [Verrucomicrobiaceae bacterium R5-34]|nr:hypothetical protein [Verrucomicrobiaceae bacterium R5-34]